MHRRPRKKHPRTPQATTRTGKPTGSHRLPQLQEGADAGADADADEDGEREAADSGAEEPEREGRPTPTGNQRRPQPRLLT